MTDFFQHAKVLDATAFVGDFPFRGFPQTSPQALKKLTQEYSLGGAVVSSFSEIFWENNFEAARRLADEIQGDDFFTHFVVVNPTYPRQLKELPEVLQATGARGIRLLPNYHDYRLWDERALELFQFAHEHSLPVQIFREIQDERMHWLRHFAPTAAADFEWFLSALDSPEIPACRVLLSGLTFADLTRMGDALRERKTVWADLSRVRGPLFCAERLVNEQQHERLVFGSLWPIQIMAATLSQIADAEMDDAVRAKMLGENWRDFLDGTNKAEK
jgi:predicted TIM-barrel fold metal-dependent hydrolase